MYCIVKTRKYEAMIIANRHTFKGHEHAKGQSRLAVKAVKRANLHHREGLKICQRQSLELLAKYKRVVAKLVDLRPDNDATGLEARRGTPMNAVGFDNP